MTRGFFLVVPRTRGKFSHTELVITSVFVLLDPIYSFNAMN